MPKDALRIERLFSSAALYATLAIFFDYPDDTFFPRLIARQTGTDKKSVARELKRLKAIGILCGGPGGRGNAYWLNTEFALYAELVAIFAKTRQSRRYRQALSPFLEMLY